MSDADQTNSASPAEEATSRPGGHKYKQSVGLASSLFGDGGDDPFAAISGSGLDAMPEEEEEAPAPVPTVAAAGVSSTAAGPISATSTATAELFQAHSMAEQPQVASTSDLFAGSEDPSDDWFGQGGVAADPQAEPNYNTESSATGNGQWPEQEQEQGQYYAEGGYEGYGNYEPQTGAGYAGYDPQTDPGYAGYGEQTAAVYEGYANGANPANYDWSQGQTDYSQQPDHQQQQQYDQAQYGEVGAGEGVQEYDYGQHVSTYGADSQPAEYAHFDYGAASQYGTETAQYDNNYDYYATDTTQQQPQEAVQTDQGWSQGYEPSAGQSEQQSDPYANGATSQRTGYSPATQSQPPNTYGQTSQYSQPSASSSQYAYDAPPFVTSSYQRKRKSPKHQQGQQGWGGSQPDPYQSQSSYEPQYNANLQPSAYDSQSQYSYGSYDDAAQSTIANGSYSAAQSDVYSQYAGSPYIAGDEGNVYDAGHQPAESWVPPEQAADGAADPYGNNGNDQYAPYTSTMAPSEAVASPTAIAPPPKGPPKGPPRGPPRRAVADDGAPLPPPAAVEAPAEQTEAVQKAETAQAGLAIDGLAGDAEAPAPWDLPHGDGPELDEPSTVSDLTVPEEASEQTQSTDTQEVSEQTLGAPTPDTSAVALPSTPRLTVTDEFEKERSADVEGSVTDSASITHDDDDDRGLAEATRDFNALRLGRRTLSQMSDSSEVEALTSALARSQEEIAAYQPYSASTSMDRSHEEVESKAVQEEDPYGPPQTHEDPYGPPQTHEDPYGPPQTHEDPYGPPKTHEDPYGPPQTQQDPYGPPQTQQDPYGRPSGLAVSSTESNHWPSTNAQTEELASHDPYGAYEPLGVNGSNDFALRSGQQKEADPYGPVEDAYGAAEDSYSFSRSQQQFDPRGSDHQSHGPPTASTPAKGASQRSQNFPPYNNGTDSYGADPYGSDWNRAGAGGEDVYDGHLHADASIDRPFDPYAAPSEGQASYGMPIHAQLSREKTVTQRDVSNRSRQNTGLGPQPNPYFQGQALSSHGQQEPTVYAPNQSSTVVQESEYNGQAVDAAQDRRNARIPLATFGIDGKIAMFFPSSSSAGPMPLYGSGNDTASRNNITVRHLADLIPPTSFSSSFDPLKFPGPAFEHAGAPSSAIARATGSSGGLPSSAKSKKAILVKYLREAAEEAKAGLSYRKRGGFGGEVSQASADRDARRAEDRVILVTLIALLLENDANMTKNDVFDDAVRTLLAPDASKGATSTFAPAFAPPTSDTDEGETLHTYDVTTGSMKQIRTLLMAGQRNEAVDFAVSKKMWAHAMVLSSAIDQATWRRVAQSFIEHEIGSQTAMSDSADAASLQIVYQMFSGQEPSAIYNAFRPAETAQTAQGGAGDNSWRESAAMILSNRCSGDSVALTAMGDGLLSGGWVEAAHICYLLSQRGAANPSVDALASRAPLLGALSPAASSTYLRDMDHYILSEAYEFSLALVPSVKGHESFPGLPHLQAYRLIHAYQLAELGEPKRAQKYCEAIAGVLKASKHSPYFNRVLVSQVKELSDRLVGGPQLDSGGNWVTRKIQRPTLDGMLSAFEGRFTKFIAGDDSVDSAATGLSTKGKAQSASAQIGAFSHYTAITPDANSGGVSRAGSVVEFGTGNSRPSSRAAYGQSATSTGPMQIQQDRAALLMTRGSFSTSPYDSPSRDAMNDGWASSRPSSELADGQAGHAGRGSSEYSPWQAQSGSTYDGASQGGYQPPTYGYDSAAESADPGRPQFFSNSEGLPPQDHQGAGAAEFVSPMDAYSANSSMIYHGDSPGPTHQGGQGQGGQNQRGWYGGEEEEDDDLGFGNSSHKKKQPQTDDGGAANAEAEKRRQEVEAKKKEEEDKAKKPELSKTASSSWLSRLWTKNQGSTDPAGAATPKVAQAHMGEESAFFYDKDLKRWVNKKSSDSTSTTSTPPPPPRATTASPSMAGRPTPLAGRSVSSSSLGNRMVSSSSDVPPPAASSSFSGFSRGTTPILENEAISRSPTSTPPPAGRPMQPGQVQRARSNLGDLSQPAAVQPPPNRPGSAASFISSSATGAVNSAASPPPMPPMPSSAVGPGGGPPPPLGNRTASMKSKKPISKRYVRVD